MLRASRQASCAHSARWIQTSYAATGGWGFADFKDGKPADESVHKGCFSCHQLAKDHDLVFARYAP